MEETLRIVLPIYFVLYFGIAFLAKSFFVARRVGKSPLVLPKDDSAYGLVGRYFKLLLVGIFLYVITYAVSPATHQYFGTFDFLQRGPVAFAGLGCLMLSFLWTMVAQNHMRDSWRIGIDNERTDLVTAGLFTISRNPIFLGMIMTLIGLFLTTPNAVTLASLLIGYVLIQMQVRLEEAHLKATHGQQYLEYKTRVRRFL